MGEKYKNEIPLPWYKRDSNYISVMNKYFISKSYKNNSSTVQYSKVQYMQYLSSKQDKVTNTV
jgi:hypothetical protein